MPQYIVPVYDLNGNGQRQQVVFLPNKEEVGNMTKGGAIMLPPVLDAAKCLGECVLYTACAGIEQWMNFGTSIGRLLRYGTWYSLPENTSWKKIVG